jgi:hypothetical protein
VKVDVGKQWRGHCALRSPRLTDAPCPIVQNARLEPLAHKAYDALVANPMLQESDQPCLVDPVEEASDIGVKNPVHAGGADPDSQGIERIVLTAPRPESVREPEEVFLVDRTEHHDHRALDDFVFQGSDSQRALFAVLLQDEPSLDGQRPVRAASDSCVQTLEVALQFRLVVLPRQPHPRRERHGA